MPTNMGAESHRLILEKSNAFFGRSAGAGGLAPSKPPRICFCAGQMTNQTLNHITEPSRPPTSIHRPRRDNAPSAS